MNTLHGYWYCATCEDTVTLPLPVGRWDVRNGVVCPKCHKPTANFLAGGLEAETHQHTLSTEKAKELFKRTYAAISNLDKKP